MPTRPDDDYDDEDDRPRRRRRPDDEDDFDDEDDDRPRRRRRRDEPELGWFDKQFGNTSMVLLVLFSLCCGVIALAFGIVGLATCQDPKARQNALVVTIISAIMVGIGVVANFARLSQMMR